MRHYDGIEPTTGCAEKKIHPAHPIPSLHLTDPPPPSTPLLLENFRIYKALPAETAPHHSGWTRGAPAVPLPQVKGPPHHTTLHSDSPCTVHRGHHYTNVCIFKHRFRIYQIQRPCSLVGEWGNEWKVGWTAETSQTQRVRKGHQNIYILHT